jgi:hypothetical protein
VQAPICGLLAAFFDAASIVSVYAATRKLSNHFARISEILRYALVDTDRVQEPAESQKTDDAGADQHADHQDAEHGDQA